MMRESTHPGKSSETGASRATPRGVDQPLSVGPNRLDNRVFLAPLSGISDVAFRRLARRFGAGLVVSEMVASGEFVKGCDASAMRAMRDGSGTHAVQLAGRDPRWMRQAAERLADLGADIVDINMGCPAKKVVGGLSGSALMREPDLALRIIDATVAGAGDIPVTLKLRLGWDRASINAPELAARAEAAGVRMITVHGRTRADFYEGKADWPAIAAVRDAVTVPVVANGDLTHSHQLEPMLASSRADAVMVGRGAQGRPWLPGLLVGRVGLKDLSAIRLFDLVEEHYDMMLAHYGLKVGVRHARKHLGWYLDRFGASVGPITAADRVSVMAGREPAGVVVCLRRLFGDARLSDVEPTFQHDFLRDAA